MYAMVQKVVNPARISVVNLALGMASGYSISAKDVANAEGLPHMTRSIQMEVSPDEGRRHKVIESGLVPLDETHVHEDD